MMKRCGFLLLPLLAGLVANQLLVLSASRKLKDPDGQELETLRVFFKRKVWTNEQVSDWDEWILKIQQRRNTVHAYIKREIGSSDEWRADLRTHLMMIRTLDSRLPYPDGDYYVQTTPLGELRRA